MTDKLKEIAAQWDLISTERFVTLLNKEDKTYENILTPLFISYAQDNKDRHFLDVGCGLGFLTNAISKFARSVTAIDISKASLNLAIKHNGCDNINYINDSIENFNPYNTFDLIIANMVLMDMPEIETALGKIYNLMNENAIFVFTITHPAFWPIYWKYSETNGFRYNDPVEIITDFKISNKTYDNLKTSHFHRPIHYYVNILNSVGFKLQQMQEIQDETEDIWYPRFLLFALKKS